MDVGHTHTPCTHAPVKGVKKQAHVHARGRSPSSKNLISSPDLPWCFRHSIFAHLCCWCMQAKKRTSRSHRPQHTPTQNSRFPPAKHPHRALPHTGTHCCPNTPTRDHCSLHQLLHKHLNPNLLSVCSMYSVTHMPRCCQLMCEPGSGSMEYPGYTSYSDQRSLKLWIFPDAHRGMHIHTQMFCYHRQRCPWLPSSYGTASLLSLTYPFFTVYPESATSVTCCYLVCPFTH